MTDAIRRTAAKAVVFALVLLCSATLSARVVSRFLHPAAVSPWEGVYTEERLEKATERFTGRVAASVRPLLSGDTTLAVVLRSKDVKSCEDLGRQLRHLRRVAPGRSIVVWTEAGGVDDVRRFLRRERVSDVRVSAVELAAVLEHRAAFATPAALVILDDGRVVQGIAHPVRFPNMRLRSFAEELTLLGAK
jgi:hypothetical protein